MKALGDIVVASTNKNKLMELQSVAKRHSLALLSPAECKEKYRLGPWPEVEENGKTFAENAFLKADAFAGWSGITALGDDSGLEVKALHGKPGIFSARYAPTDSERIEKLLGELSTLEKKSEHVDRRATFRCVLVLASPETGKVVQAEGALHGSILRERRGTGGFGYDPIVFLDKLQATLAEIDFERTCREGFRALAAEHLFTMLKELA